MKALLVEDDGAIAMVVRTALADEGFTVIVTDSIAGRDAALAREVFDVLLTDIMLADGDGLDSVDHVRALYPQLPVIVLSAQNTLDTALRADAAQAYEYFPKPFDIGDLVAAAKRAANRSVGYAAGEGEAGGSDGDTGNPELPLVGRSPAMQTVFRLITRVLNNDLTVLITGESGTGKELVAEAIHQLGQRKSGPFVAVNAAAIPADLIESELFGHEKGAFTGAVAQSIGKFEQANGGTLFLDEIGDMPMEAQTRLLRALQSGRIRRVGGRAEIPVDIRILAATNRDLMPMIAGGTFREDLYYRLNVVPIALPPLRDRADDVPALARHFLAQAEQEGLPRRSLSREAEDLLLSQAWPGNIRELRNLMLRSALLAREPQIERGEMAELLRGADAVTGRRRQHDSAKADWSAALDRWLEEANPPDGTLYHAALAAFERPLLAHALRRTGGNQLRAAQLLGINRNTLRRRLSDLDIDPDRYA